MKWVPIKQTFSLLTRSKVFKKVALNLYDLKMLQQKCHKLKVECASWLTITAIKITTLVRWWKEYVSNKLIKTQQ